MIVLLEAVCAALAATAMIRGIQLSTRVGIVLEISSVLAILVVAFAVLAKFGLSSEPFAPADLGISGVTGGMVLAILGYVGFESAACLGTEAKTPGSTIPKAVLGSVLIVSVLYLISAYAQMVGFGDPAKITASPAPFNDLADASGLHALGYLIDFGAAASFFACVTGSINAASRLLHQLGQTDLLHRSMGTAHATRQTPHLAIALLSAAVGLTAIVMSLNGVTTVNVFAYAGTIGTYGYMIAYILITVGVAVLLRRAAEPFTGALVMGTLATLGMAYVLYRNVYPVPAEPYNRLPWIFGAVLVASGAWYALVSLSTGPAVADPLEVGPDGVPDGG